MNWSKILSETRFRDSTRNITNSDRRNEFESDFGRIVFSPAIRRMHDKTQVFPLITDDNIHTRLTHSLEVQSVASSIGMNLCLNHEFVEKTGFQREDLVRKIPVILSCIGLCHDIGNPPFGHFGEKVIANYFQEYFKENKLNLKTDEAKDFENFNGNAQGFRILTKLQVLNDEFGLNLTAAVLSSYLKYPNLSNEVVSDSKDYKGKLGVFQSEKDRFLKLKREVELDGIRNPLSFLMEAADNICYLTMDLEDGFNKEYYDFNYIINFFVKEGNDLVKQSLKHFKEKVVIIENKAINVERTKIVNLRIFLIQKLVNIACTRFSENISEIEGGSYRSQLLYDKNKGLADTLKVFCDENILNNREIHSLEITGQSVLRGLLGYFVESFIHCDDDEYCWESAKKLFNLIGTSLKSAIELETGKSDLREIDTYYKLRMIVDYISGMTDFFALNFYQKLSGIKIA